MGTFGTFRQFKNTKYSRVPSYSSKRRLRTKLTSPKTCEHRNTFLQLKELSMHSLLLYTTTGRHAGAALDVTRMKNWQRSSLFAHCLQQWYNQLQMIIRSFVGILLQEDPRCIVCFFFFFSFFFFFFWGGGGGGLYSQPDWPQRHRLQGQTAVVLFLARAFFFLSFFLSFVLFFFF